MLHTNTHVSGGWTQNSPCCDLVSFLKRKDTAAHSKYLQRTRRGACDGIDDSRIEVQLTVGGGNRALNPEHLPESVFVAKPHLQLIQYELDKRCLTKRGFAIRALISRRW